MMNVVNFIQENVGVINEGNKFMFKGIVRGADYPAITYIAETVEEIIEGLILEEWIYYIKPLEVTQ